MPQPPPLPEKRRSPRVEIFAQVEIKGGASIHILRVRDASEIGLFIEGAPGDYPDLVVGATVELDLMPEDDTTGAPILMKGRIARVVTASGGRPGGFGVEASAADDTSRARLRQLVERGRPL